jgi:hypothetical protein
LGIEGEGFFSGGSLLSFGFGGFFEGAGVSGSGLFVFGFSGEEGGTKLFFFSVRNFSLTSINIFPNQFSPLP